MGDCAVMPQPTSGELAQIAVSSAETARALVGMGYGSDVLQHEGKQVATTKHCAGGGSDEKAQELVAPNLLIDGELQLDSALDPILHTRRLLRVR